jgi:hypothetical protein
VIGYAVDGFDLLIVGFTLPAMMAAFFRFTHCVLPAPALPHTYARA